MKIISYRNKSDIDIEFQDENKYVSKHNLYVNFERGQVKNPYDRSICGHGYIGVGQYKAGSNVRAYVIWRSMFMRCYAETSKHLFPAYYGVCSVCREWCNYQVFAKWYYDNYYEVDGRLHIDKDILCPGNKIYSPDKCLLVPQRINMLFVKHRKNHFNLPEGILLTKSGKYKTTYQGVSYGTFSTIEEAICKYLETKENAIQTIAESYKSIIPQKVYDALKNYEVTVVMND